jgi:hypothetical protein
VRCLLAAFVAVALAPYFAGAATPRYVLALALVTLAPVAQLWHLLRAPVRPERIARAARLSRWVWVSSFLPLALLK